VAFKGRHSKKLKGKKTASKDCAFSPRSAAGSDNRANLHTFKYTNTAISNMERLLHDIN